MYLPFQAVHAPLEATKHWLDMQHPLHTFNNDSDRRTYAAMVGNMVRALYLYAPFFVQWAKNRLCVLDRHYAGTA